VGFRLLGQSNHCLWIASANTTTLSCTGGVTCFTYIGHKPSLVATVGIHDLFRETKITGEVFREHVTVGHAGTRARTCAEFARPIKSTACG